MLRSSYVRQNLNVNITFGFSRSKQLMRRVELGRDAFWWWTPRAGNRYKLYCFRERAGGQSVLNDLTGSMRQQRNVAHSVRCKKTCMAEPSSTGSSALFTMHVHVQAHQHMYEKIKSCRLKVAEA